MHSALEIKYYYNTDKGWFEYLAQSFQPYGINKVINNKLLLDPDLGKGRFEYYKLEEGLGVLLVDCVFYQDIKLVNLPSIANDHYILQFIIPANGIEITMQNETQKIGANFSRSVLFSTSAIANEIVFSQNKQIQFVQLIGSREKLISINEIYKLPNNKYFEKYLKNKPVQNVFNISITCRETVEKILASNTESPLYMLNLQSDALFLFFHFCKRVQTYRSKKENRFLDVSERIRQELTELEQKLYQPWPKLGDLAQKLGLSKTSFSTFFLKLYKKTYTQYYLELRLKKASQLIKEGSKVSEAAYAVGYLSLGHFSKVYKEQKGSYPKQRAKQRTNK